MNNTNSMQKILTISSLALVALLIIIVGVYLTLSNRIATPSIQITSPTVTIVRPSPTKKPTPRPAGSEDHHTSESRIPLELLKQDYVPTKLATVRAVKLSSFTGDPPPGWQLVSAGSTPSTPDGKYSLNKQADGVVIVDTTDGTVVRAVPVELGTGEFNAVWLTNDHIMLTEKESDPRHLDRVYIVERTSGRKAFVAGSFPTVSRFNLNSDPRVYNNGQDVIFTDNDRGRWHINILY